MSLSWTLRAGFTTLSGRCRCIRYCTYCIVLRALSSNHTSFNVATYRKDKAGKKSTHGAAINIDINVIEDMKLCDKGFTACKCFHLCSIILAVAPLLSI
jgi:hypothetical protein